MAPSHSDVDSGSVRATAPPAKPPISRAARPDAFDDGGVGGLVVAELQHEGRGHGAGERVADLVEDDEGEDRERRIAGEEFGEGALCGVEHAGQRVRSGRGVVGRAAAVSGSRPASTASMPTTTSTAATA